MEGLSAFVTRCFWYKKRILCHSAELWAFLERPLSAQPRHSAGLAGRLAWRFLRFQQNSALARWYQARTADHRADRGSLRGLGIVPRSLRFAHDSPLEQRRFELVWGFSCRVVFSVYCQFFVRSGKGRSSSRRLRSGSRSARKGSRDRNASTAWRLAALASLVFRSALTPEHAEGRLTQATGAFCIARRLDGDLSVC